MNPLNPYLRCFCDLETGGLDPLKHGITEVSAVVFDCRTFQTLESFEYLVKPEEGFTYQEEALKLQGRTLEELTRVGVPAPQVYGSLIYFLKDHLGEPEEKYTNYTGRIWAHNAPFDWSFLSRLEKSYSTLRHFQGRNYFACSKFYWTNLLGLGKVDFPYTGLEKLAKHLGVCTRDQTHTGLKDCYLGIGVLKALKERGL